MGINTSAKAQIFIGSKTYATANFDALTAADYTSESYTQIREVNDLGPFGDSAQEVKFDSLDSGRTQKLKGQRDAGDMTLEVGFDAADPGQMAALAAAQDNFNRAFKVVFSDAPTPTGTPTTSYFRGMVMSAIPKPGNANAVVMLTLKISINSAPIIVPASA